MKMNLIIISNIFLLSCIVLSCSKIDVYDAEHQLYDLEQKYHVKINKTSDAIITQNIVDKIENKIIYTKNQVFNNKIIGSVIDTKVQDSHLIHVWAFNLTWLNVLCSVDYSQYIFNVSSWLSGITIYNYSQVGLVHNYSRDNQNNNINFVFYCTFSVGVEPVEITISAKCDGYVNFKNHFGEITTSETL